MMLVQFDRVAIKQNTHAHTANKHLHEKLKPLKGQEEQAKGLIGYVVIRVLCNNKQEAMWLLAQLKEYISTVL